MPDLENAEMNRRAKILALGLLILISFSAILFTIKWDRSNWKALNAPSDPQVNEAIGQARALQKLGKVSDALVVFEKYANLGYPDALFHTAKAYSRGWGSKPDLNKARSLFLKAVQYNFAYRGETAYELGRLFRRAMGPDCNLVAVKWFKKSLLWNYTKASLQLASHYERGLGVEQDIAKAVQYYEIAVRAGQEQALIKYARLLVAGRYGIEPNPDRARFLTNQAISSLERKARGGSASAAKQLGRLYRNGKLVSVDKSQAEKWLLLSAKLGSRGGMHDLAQLMLHSSKQPAKQVKALDWLRAAANLGHGGAMTALGRFHLKEAYNLKKTEAVGWFKKGLLAEHGGAMEELAKLYMKGVLVAQNYEEAVRLARRGAQRGHSGAERLLKKLLKRRKANKSS